MVTFITIKQWLFSRTRPVKIGILIAVVVIGWFVGTRIFGTSTPKPQYQTTQVVRDTLITSVSASGQVSSANSTNVSTQATGVVSKVYVKDGDLVKSGQKIAEIDSDLQGKQNAAQALASYQSAKNTLAAAQANLYTTQSDMLTNWQSYMNTAQSVTYQNGDGSPNDTNRALVDFHVSQNDWLATEAKYKNQQNAVIQAQTSLNASWLSYQQSSPTIYAPISGTISGLSLQVGSVITASQNSNSGAQMATKIANIKTDAMPTMTLNLTQVDAPTVSVGNKATLTFDAFPNKTFTGKVISLDTVGAVSSGVTTYAAVIKLDTSVPGLLSNMTGQASIITLTKDNVLLVPSSAVQTQNGQSYLRVMKNGAVTQVSVETSLASATQTEITSGVSEGDTIVTGTIAAATQTSTQSTSPFSALGGSRGFGGGAGGGGAAVRVNTGR